MKEIIIMCGISASGKTTIQRELIESGFAHKVITSTTREIRVKDNEVNGVDYHFKTIEDFQSAIKNNDLIEYEKHGENYYGTPWSSLESDKGTIPCAILEPKGAKNIKGILESNGWKVKTVFIDCPLDVAKERIQNRDSDNKDALEKRLKLMDTVESGWSSYMDYDVVVKQPIDTKKAAKKIKAAFQKKRVRSRKP